MATVLWTLVVILILLAAGVGFAYYAGWLPLRSGGASQAQAQTSQAAPQPQQQPQQPQLNIVKNEPIGDWVYFCVQPPNGDPVRCAISQQLNNADTGAGVFIWRIIQDGSGGYAGEWETPTGVVVGRGIVLDAGTRQPVTIPFQACTQTGCIATASLAPDFLEAVARSPQANVTLFPIGAQPVRLNLSVNGLAQALAALGYQPPPAAPAAGEPAAPADGATPAAQ